IASYAGYKDWFIQDYRRPGYTMEVGKGRNPLPISQFDQIYSDSLEVLLLGSII
ncbi:MAG: peptidase M14, partial [Clostridiales bacterium]|nr:peptidase M14 [Clostridiales bacterium]